MIAAQTSPFRVALVASRFPVMSETFVATMAAGLLERGHDVAIHAVQHGRTGQVHASVRRAGLLERIVAPPAAGAPIGARAAAVARAAAAVAGDMVGGRGPTSVALRNAPMLAALAMTFAGREPYDIIHAQFGPLGALMVRLRDAGIVQARIVTHFRGYDVSQYVRRHGAGVYRELFAKGDLFVANCEYFRDLLDKLDCDPARTCIVGSGIDTRQFEFRTPPPPGPGPARLVTVGRLTAKKGVDVLLRAVSRLRDRGRACTLAIVGEGPCGSELRTLTRELGLDDAVTFHGSAVQEDIPSILAGADLFVAASVVSPEGDCDGPVNSAKEAMAIGLPCVGTRHGGIPELIEDGISGRLVAEGDPDALGQAIAELLDVPETWPDLARAARRKVAGAYDMQVVSDLLVTHYRDLLVTARGSRQSAPAKRGTTMPAAAPHGP